MTFTRLDIKDDEGMAAWIPTKWPTIGDCKKLAEVVERAKRVMEGKA